MDKSIVEGPIADVVNTLLNEIEYVIFLLKKGDNKSGVDALIHMIELYRGIPDTEIRVGVDSSESMRDLTTKMKNVLEFKLGGINFDDLNIGDTDPSKLSDAEIFSVLQKISQGMERPGSEMLGFFLLTLRESLMRILGDDWTVHAFNSPFEQGISISRISTDWPSIDWDYDTGRVSMMLGEANTWPPTMEVEPLGFSVSRDDSNLASLLAFEAKKRL